ncbi:hypothetical protein I307_02819 [Cryptococcus deuterogattii 99/473]|uniref:ER transporter 6TM N-terminal domain-containing protein n=1 Tax=Cryptococcus deuterogattii Ram5 TaxID=1296110 RepID=A0A0D0V1D3_9TREE|nr:hypothetical protein I313_05373 [Cryptococcus deuterogattii Ram5]KIY57746.1 hypothetical protein I307_02819 [Cryptococcus deuterogattii 99/473]
MYPRNICYARLDALDKIGSAAFFAPLVSQMLPPYMALSIYIFALITLVVGLCFGWAWGAAAMAAALRARSQSLYQSQLQAESAGYNQSESTSIQFQQSIFHAAFLDPRSSAVYGVFLFFGAYGLGFLRATNPKLTLGCIFGTIIIDLMCTIGPLFPVAQYTLAKQLIIPAACYIAIALASIIFIFPQTLNHIVLDSLNKTILTPAISLLAILDEVLETSPSDAEAWGKVSEKGFETRDKLVAAVTALEGQTGMLQLEITRGQIGPKDLEKVIAKLKAMCGTLYGVTSFAIIIHEQNTSEKDWQENPMPHPTVGAQKHWERLEEYNHPSRSLDALVPILNESSTDLRQASTKALKDISQWLSLVNHTRWKKVPADAPPLSQREENLENVKRALEAFRASKQFDVLEPYREFFDPITGEIKPEALESYRYLTRDLFRVYVLTSNLINFTLSLVTFLSLLLDIEKANPKSKIQLPNKFAKMLLKNASDKSGGGNPLDMGLKDTDGIDEASGRTSEATEDDVDDDDDDESVTTTTVEKKKDTKKKKEKKKRVYAKDPDAGDPRNALQRLGRHIYTLWKGLTGNSGIFALKYALVSIALFVPAVCENSAQFYYENRGLWALIMAQTGMGVFTGEQITSFVVRMGGTATGLVVGMLAWYIGSGHGNGNPYGVTAATFVVGYSWVDEHTPQSANQGHGAGLAGRRALLVIIAAFIMMVFPRPNSARALFRRRLAKNMSDISDLYGKVVTSIENEVDAAEWGKEDGTLKNIGGEADSDAVEKRRQQYRGIFLKVMGRLMGMKPHLYYASGPWPKKKYAKLYRAQGQVLATLALLAAAYSRMSLLTCKRLATRSDLMHPAFYRNCGRLARAARAARGAAADDRDSQGSEKAWVGEEKRSLLLGGKREREDMISDGDGEKMENGKKENGENGNGNGNGNGKVEEDKDEMPRDEHGNVDRTELVRRNAEKVMKGIISWDNWHVSVCSRSALR